jgi:hypothetical protein
MPQLQLKLEFWTQNPNSWDSTFQMQSLVSTHKIKRHGERQRREIYYMVQDPLGEEAE